MRPLRSVTTSFRSRRLVHSAFHLRFREPFFSKLSSPRLDRCARIQPQATMRINWAKTAPKAPQKSHKAASERPEVWLAGHSPRRKLPLHYDPLTSTSEP